MSLLDVTIRGNSRECTAKIEALPTMIQATTDGVLQRYFWVNLCMVIDRKCLATLMVPGGNLMHDFVLTHGATKYNIRNPVVYNQTDAPVGNLTVVQIDFTSGSLILDPQRN